MFVDRGREKLLNAMKYFIANTRYCHTLKVFKLLNFLDFEHYRQTGKSVTGLTYKAWNMGPVPDELWHELTNRPKPDLVSAIEINHVKDDLTDAALRRDLKVRQKFDPAHFTKRELKIMARLVELFAEVQADDMSKVSHARGLPWGKVFEGGKGSGRTIPYELAYSSDSMMSDVSGLSDVEAKARKELFADIPGPP